MSDNWAQRQRDTQELIGLISDYLLRKRRITADQLFGLCALTWITQSSLGDGAGYIRATKLPALLDIFGPDFPATDLASASLEVRRRLGSSRAAELVKSHTGFTNFYNAYRRSSRSWLHSNRAAIVRLLRIARNLKSDKQASLLAARISSLPGIDKGMGGANVLLQPARLLSPLFFSIDPRSRFPLINGSPGLKRLLATMGVSNGSLAVQHDAMVRLIGTHGINDSVDLDRYAHGMTSSSPATAVALTEKTVIGRTLPLKDASDIEAIKSASKLVSRRLHNRMTNGLKKICSAFELTEGTGNARYDVNVSAFDGESDLMIEVKSSSEESHVRMAIGQLLAYAFHDKRSKDCAKAVLLPCEPEQAIKDLLAWVEIGCLWLNEDGLQTSTSWLEDFAGAANAVRD